MLKRPWRTAAVLCSFVLALRSAASAASPIDAAAQALLQGAHRRVLELLPHEIESAEARLVRAQALLQLGRAAEASAALADVAAGLPAVADVVAFLQGEAFAASGELESAQEAFARATAAPGSRVVDRALLRRAELLTQLGRPRAALLLRALLLRSDPSHPQRPAIELAMARNELATHQPRAAATRLRQLWLTWPESAAATAAEAELEALQAGKHPVLATPGLYDRLERARRLRRHKRYDDALRELEAARAAWPQAAARLDDAVASTLRQAGRADEAAALFAGLLGQAPAVGRARLRRLLADCLARLQRLDEGLALYGDPLSDPRATRTLAGRATLLEVTGLLERHGRYQQALTYYERAWEGRVPSRQNLRPHQHRLAWLTYRAGDLPRAIERLQPLLSDADERLFAAYWQARAHAALGDKARALALFGQLWAEAPAGYYGQLARSRLIELGQLPGDSPRCPQAPSASSAAPATPAAPAARTEQLDALTERWGAQLPRLARARLLWRAGLEQDARRELLLTALEYGRTVYGHGARAFAVRQDALRLWRGAGQPLPPFWGARGLALRRAASELEPALGGLLASIGNLDFLAARLAPAAESTPEQRRFPRRYEALVRNAATRHGLDPHLVWAIIHKESAFRPDALSRVGAAGLMQLMPRTAARLAAESKLALEDGREVFEPPLNLALGTRYLRALVDKFRGQLPLVAAAYNGGPGNVAAWLDWRGRGAELDQFVEEIPFRESRGYAKKVVALHAAYRRTYCGAAGVAVPNRLDTRYAAAPSY